MKNPAASAAFGQMTPVLRQVETRREIWVSHLLAGIDVVIIFACLAFGRSANLLFSGGSWDAPWFHVPSHHDYTSFALYIAIGIVCLVAFRQLGHYTRRRPLWQELGDVLSVMAVMALLDGAALFLMEANLSRLWWVTSWILAALSVPLGRLTVKRLLMTQDAWLTRTVIVGTGRTAIEAASALLREGLLGFEVIAFIQPPETTDAPAYLEIGGRRLPVVAQVSCLELLPAHLGRPHVVVALEPDELRRCASYVERLSRCYGEVDIISPMHGLPLAGAQFIQFLGHDVLALRLHNNLGRVWPRVAKRGIDLLLGALILAIVSPLFAFIAWRVARTGRPVFYRHQRIGKGGRRFYCLKFRTMVPDADAELERHLAAHPEARDAWLRDHKLKEDPRITPIGAWLRRTSMDELPQLINVLRGEMSLVGPRPVVEDELARYGADLIYYMESMPGVTGLWQVSGRNDLDYRSRVHLDCWYVKNWSLWCDLVILIKTPRAVLRGHGAY